MASTPSKQTKQDLAKALYKLNFVSSITDHIMQSRVRYLKRTDVDLAFQRFFKAVCTGHLEIDDSNINVFKTIFLADILSENDPYRVISEGVKEAFLDFKEKAVVARLRSIALFTCIEKRGEGNVKPKFFEMFHLDVQRAMTSFQRLTEVKHTILRLKYATAIKKGLAELKKTRLVNEPLDGKASDKDLERLEIRHNLAKHMKIIVVMYERKGGSNEDFSAWQREILGRTLDEELAADAP